MPFDSSIPRAEVEEEGGRTGCFSLPDNVILYGFSSGGREGEEGVDLRQRVKSV